MVTDGRSINIWEDNWIPNTPGTRTQSPKPVNCSLHSVAELIDHERGIWRWAIVNQIFIPTEAQQILQLPISLCGMPDKLIWRLERNGRFSVRSAYHTAHQLNIGRKAKAETSHAGEQQRSLWQKFWKLPIKNKLKHFGWKCFYGWLPVSSALKKRGVEIDEICRRCGQEKETIEHALFQCPESELVWKIAPVH